MPRLLFEYLQPYRRQIALVVALLVVQTIGNLYLPELNADIINNGVAKGDTAYITQVGMVMLLVTAVIGVCSVIAVYWSARVAMGFGRDVRSGIFRKVESFSQADLDHIGTPSLITRNTNDVQQVQMVVLIGLTVMISAPIMAVGGVIMAVRLDPPLSAILVVIIPIMGVVIGLVMWRALPLFRAMQVKIDRLNQVTREALAGVRVIRAFVRTRREQERFDAANVDLTDTALRVNRLFAVTIPTMFAILNLSTVAVLWFGAFRVDSGAMPIGDLTAFLTYLMQILMSVLMAVIMFVMVPRAAASSERIREVLDTEPSIVDVALPVIPASQIGRVELRDVDYAYRGAEEPVLRGVSFTAEPGQTTAIVGSTGSGKSTLVNLIPRFFDATAGSVLVDGVDVRAMPREELWRRIGVVPQKAFLFSGTVASNLRYGDPDATDADLWHALETSQARSFVEEMAEGLEAPVAQGGQNLSGGQRQRLSIARALVKKPSVVVFDDSFSALDFKTDSLLRAALRRELASAAVLIVAQRVGTIMHADRIVVLESGRVVGVGTHAGLLETCETYREIVYSQLTEEEAA